MVDDLRNINREVFEGEAIVMRSADAQGVYEDAVEHFSDTGDRAALYSALLELGVPADVIRWHATHPGQRRVTIAVGG